MDDDDFVQKSPLDSASKSKSVSKCDGKFVHPLPVTPKQFKGSVPQRVSESENSTAVAGNLTETDESVLCGRGDWFTIRKCQRGGLFSSPSQGRNEKWEQLKTWIFFIYSIDTIFNEIVTIFKAEIAAGVYYED